MRVNEKQLEKLNYLFEIYTEKSIHGISEDMYMRGFDEGTEYLIREVFDIFENKETPQGDN